MFEEELSDGEPPDYFNNDDPMDIYNISNDED